MKRPSSPELVALYNNNKAHSFTKHSTISPTQQINTNQYTTHTKTIRHESPVRVHGQQKFSILQKEFLEWKR